VPLRGKGVERGGKEREGKEGTGIKEGEGGRFVARGWKGEEKREREGGMGKEERGGEE